MACGVYKRASSPYWWIWYGTGKERKMESSGKRLIDPLGWKHAHDLARTKAGSGAAPASTKKGDFDVWVEGYIKTFFPDPAQARSLRVELVHWRFLRGFLGSVNILNPSGLSYAIAQDYLTWRQRNGRSGRVRIHAAAKEISLLRRLMGEAVKRGFIAASPIAGMKVKTPRHREKPEISVEEEAIIRNALLAREGLLPVTERWKTISFLFGIRHGWRIAETSFPLSRVNFDKWEVLVRSKGDRWRTVPLHPEVRPVLTELKAAKATLSCAFPSGKPDRASYLWTVFLKEIKLPHLSHHCCRVSVVSRLARAGVSERLVMEFVGHWSTTSHRIYSRVAHGDLARCISLDDPPSASSPNP
jgi:integrase